MAKSHRNWSIRIVAPTIVGVPTYDVCQFIGSEDDIMALIDGLSKLPRPVAIASDRLLWLREGDMLVAVPEATP